MCDHVLLELKITLFLEDGDMTYDPFWIAVLVDKKHVQSGGCNKDEKAKVMGLLGKIILQHATMQEHLSVDPRDMKWKK